MMKAAWEENTPFGSLMYLIALKSDPGLHSYREVYQQEEGVEITEYEYCVQSCNNFGRHLFLHLPFYRTERHSGIRTLDSGLSWVGLARSVALNGWRWDVY